MSDILDDLQWRGLIALSTDLGALGAVLDAGPVTFYCGFDPTAPSLHMGSLLQLLTMRRLQNAGHRPLVLVGGSTGLIGDPKPTAERVLKDKETTAAYVDRVRAQVGRYFGDQGPNAVSLVNNLDWTEPMSAIDFLRDIGKWFRVGTMIKKDAVSARLSSAEGISYTEFSYQILQGMDFLELFRQHGCVLQTGGSDQWGNLTSGTDLIHHVTGERAHLLATPLMTKADGTKYGKTETGTVWLDPELTSPYAFYQFWLNAEDATVGMLLRAYSFRNHDELAELERSVEQTPHLRLAQKALAEEVTALVHGREAVAQAQAASQALFGRGELAALDPATLGAALIEAGSVDVTGEVPAIVDLLTLAGLCDSRSAARRTVGEGGAYLNNVKIVDPEHVPSAGDRLPGGWLVLRRGKKAMAGVRVVD